MKRPLLSILATLLVMGAISAPAGAGEWEFHQYVWSGGIVVIKGTEDFVPVDPPMYVEDLPFCSYVSGGMPPWNNDFLVINNWVHSSCANIDSFKVAVPIFWEDQWDLENMRDWLENNLPPDSRYTMPVVGDSTGTNPFIHSICNLEEWVADPRPLQDTYVIVDGECPDLPGYLIGTTPITFDPDAGPDESPFGTTPYSGTLWRSGDVSMSNFGVPTTTRKGIIVLTAALLAVAVLLIHRRIRAVRSTA